MKVGEKKVKYKKEGSSFEYKEKGEKLVEKENLLNEMYK